MCGYQQGSCSHRGSGCHMSGWSEGWSSYQDMYWHTPRTPCCTDISCLWKQTIWMLLFQWQSNNSAKHEAQYTVQLMPVMQGQTFKWALTAKSCIPPLLWFATCMDTLSGKLGDGFAEDRVSFVFRVAHISLTGFTEGFHIQTISTTAKRSTAEYLVTELLKRTKLIDQLLYKYSVWSPYNL